MKTRFLLTAATALALIVSGALVSSARGDDVEADVGGGAAGIVATVFEHSFDLAPLFQDNDKVSLTVSQPRVVMGKNGGNSTWKVLNTTVAGISAKAIVESVKGNRHGTPYAEASSTLEDVRIPKGTLAGTALGTLTSSCRWDTAGAKGQTTILDVNGNTTEPAVNEVHDLGVATLTLNEQHTDSIYMRDSSGNLILGSDGNYLTEQTLYVIAAHIHSEEPLVLVDGETTQDLYIGFTSCDPLKLPPLSGLTQSQTST